MTGFSAGSAPVFSNAPVSSRVLILAASTSGWLNGLMPSIAPATAVAISNRKNSWPIWSIDCMTIRTTGWPAFSSAASFWSCAASSSPSVRRSMKKRSLPYTDAPAIVSPSIGIRPLPSLPVDSAINCSAQAPKSATFFEEKIVTLSRPSRPARPIARPSCTPGFSCGGTSAPQERTIASACVITLRTSIPAAAAGTRPNGDSTE